MSLPNGAAGAIERYLDAVDAAVPGLVVGLHVCGSLALGDYLAERSDIDVVVVVADATTNVQRALLAEIHRVNATRIDGPYLTADALHGSPDDVGAVPFHVDGRFEFGTCHDVSPITWAILAGPAISVRGDRPCVHIDEEAVKAFSAENLRGYWANWARTIAALLDGTADDDTVEARLLEWGVLGTARVYRAATTGEVVSKRRAGEYAMEMFGDEWHDVVERALATRRGEIDDVRVSELRRACAFVRALTT